VVVGDIANALTPDFLRSLIDSQRPISAHGLGLVEARLRIRSAVLRPLRGVGSNALLRARDTSLDIALGALQTVTQHMKAGSMAAVARGIGHECLSMVLGGAVCAVRFMGTTL
jgi:hypothetical protein